MQFEEALKANGPYISVKLRCPDCGRIAYRDKVYRSEFRKNTWDHNSSTATQNCRHCGRNITITFDDGSTNTERFVLLISLSITQSVKIVTGGDTAKGE